MLSKHHQISLNAYKSCEILLMETQARITACDLPKKKHEQRNEIESPPFSAFIRISGIRYTQKTPHVILPFQIIVMMPAV